MKIEDVFLDSILLIGCGKMGGALLDGWIENGLKLENAFVIEPKPNKRLQNLEKRGLTLNPKYALEVGTCILAIKPQNMDYLLKYFPKKVSFSILISVIAGTPISKLRDVFGDSKSIYRAMPNTPSLVSAGITAIYGEEGSNLEKVDLLMSSVGNTVRLKKEDHIDVATAISGSGPAYAFLLIEAMALIGVELGLSKEISLNLAKNTVFGAGKLCMAVSDSPEILRENVTSPGGTTEAALKILMNENSLKNLMGDAIKAAHQRSLELRK